MKKAKFSVIILSFLIFCASALTGCAIVTPNMERYYAAPVASISGKVVVYNQEKVEKALADGEEYNGEEVELNIQLNKRDLVDAYNRYGYYYEQYYGKEMAVQATVDQLESQKIVAFVAKQTYMKSNGEYLDEEEKSYLWHETNDAIEDNFFSYVQSVVGQNPTNDSSTTDDTTISKFSYTHNGVLDGQNNPKKAAPLEEIFNKDEYKDGRDFAKQEDRKLIYTNLIEIVRSVKGTVYTDAFKDYKDALKDYEEGLNKSTLDAEIFDREIERVYKLTEENYLVEKYFDSFKDKSTDSPITAEKILELYSSKVLNSYNQYKYENDTNYENNVLSNVGDVYYFKHGDDDTKFYQVAHILFKLDAGTHESDTPGQAEEQEQDDYDAITPVVRRANRDGVYEEVNYGYNEKGEYNANLDERQWYEKSVKSLYNYIKNAIENQQTDIEKAEKFNEFIYMYNEDPGIINSDYNYVMGINYTKGENKITLDDGREYYSYSNMVEPFTKAGAALYDDGNGKIGDISPLIKTTNGYHILMYLGPLTNIYEEPIQTETGFDINFSKEFIRNLSNTRLNLRYDKTLFDLLYDELNVDNFSSFQNDRVKELRDCCKFTTYPDNYSDLTAE